VFLHNNSMGSCCARTLARPPRGSVLLVHGGQGESLVPPYMRGSVSALSLSLSAWWWWWFGGKGLLVHLCGRGRHCVRDGAERGGAHYDQTVGVYSAWLCSVCLLYFLAFLWLVRLAGGAAPGLRALYESPFQLNSSAFKVFEWDNLSGQGTKRLSLR